jgi:hypothetical protein
MTHRITPPAASPRPAWHITRELLDLANWSVPIVIAMMKHGGYLIVARSKAGLAIL